MTREPYSPISDDRDSTRVGSDLETTFAVVYSEPGKEILAAVHDESLGGLGLIFPALPDYGLGQEVTIVFASSIFTATLTHIEPLEDGRYLAGFCCDPAIVVRSDSPILKHQ